MKARVAEPFRLGKSFLDVRHAGIERHVTVVPGWPNTDAAPNPTTVRVHVSLNEPVVPGALGGVAISHPNKSA